MPAGATYEPLATTTLSTAQTSITFSSISSSYTDLKIIFFNLAETSAVYSRIQVNGDTATNYSFTRLRGDGSAAASASNTSQTAIGINWDGGSTSTIPSLGTIDIFSYAGSTNKTFLIQGSEDQNGSGYVERIVGLWRSTSAINSVTLLTGSANKFGIGTTATLYGIKAA